MSQDQDINKPLRPGGMPDVPTGIARDLAALPAGLPAFILLGTQLALVGAFSGGVEVHQGDGADGVSVTLVVPHCACTEADRMVGNDPDCPRCYPVPPAELVALVARAVKASRTWVQAGQSDGIAGVDDGDVNAATAVLDVLMSPGRNVLS